MFCFLYITIRKASVHKFTLQSLMMSPDNKPLIIKKSSATGGARCPATNDEADLLL